MIRWNRFPEVKPEYNETVLCLLSNGQQVTLSLDEDNQMWIMYNEEELEDARVIAWRELESREEIEKQLK